MESKCLELDGSILEGGGQVMRNAVAYSAILQQPVKIVKIRGGRRKPGLKRQHLTGIKLVQEIVGGRISGAGLNASSIEFHSGPGSGRSEFVADIRTAGSTALLLQISVPCLLFQGIPCTAELKGGTNASFAPQIEYVQEIFQPFLNKHFDVSLEVECTRRGWFPRGGGRVVVKTEPVLSLPSITLLDRGEVTGIRGTAIVSGERDASQAESMVKTATKKLRKHFRGKGIPIEITATKFDRKYGNGSGISCIIIADTENGCSLAGSSLGEKKRARPEELAGNAVDMLIDNLASGSVVDEYLADQIIIFMALAQGTSKVCCGQKLSLHAETAIHFAKAITSHWAECTGQNGGKGAEFEHDKETGILVCNGIGFKNLSIEE